jgi:hypothetical protein
MRFFPSLRTGIMIAAICLCVRGQAPPSPGSPPKELQTEMKGMPPRPTAGEYQAQEQAGKVTIGAEYQGHSVPTIQGNLTTEDYVVVETGFFGPPGARITLSFDDFTLVINGKKPLPSQPYGVVLRSVKDPEWVPPDEPKEKQPSNLSVGDDPGGRGGRGGIQSGEKEPPFPVRIPIEVQRAMAERVRKASLPEGDRALPVAGLIYFPYSKIKGIHTIELVYKGAAGKATLTLQP